MNNSKKLSFIEIIFKSVFGILFILGFNPLLTGRWNYWQGWIFSAVMIIIAVIIFILFRNKLDLIRERMNPGPGVKWWDKIIFNSFSVFVLIAWVIAVFDTGRFNWSAGFTFWGYVASYLLFLFSIFMFTWPMLVNKWFSSMVRIQDDRKQQVCQDGPYKYIRHPGYTGGILMMFSIGLVFGSFWALIPGGIAAMLLILRTHLEDKTLQRELPGYLEYTRKVKYKLIPGVW